MIRFERVTYTYPFQTCPAVSDISFSVRPGELVLCTGASGCGKSTLMRLANGLCPHYFQGTLEGRVLIGGEPTDARPINAIALSRPRTAVFRPECRGRAGVRP